MSAVLLLAGAIAVSLFGSACTGCRDFGKFACQPRLTAITQLTEAQ
jgi:hypothetical protein